jgi:hypothetical protein
MAMLNNHNQRVNLHISSSFLSRCYVTEVCGDVCHRSHGVMRWILIFGCLPNPPFLSRGILGASICGHILRRGRWQIPMSVLANAENRNLSDLYRAPWRWSTASQTSCKQAKNNRTMCGIWMMNFYDFVEYVCIYICIYMGVYWVFQDFRVLINHFMGILIGCNEI